MPYIGRGISQLQTIDKLDAITPSTSTGAGPYNLTQSSSAFTPISANNLLISINGVVQYGNFTVSGSTVTFTGALSDSDTCNFILHVGEGIVNTPGAGTVSTSTIAADAVTGAKIADDAIDSEHYTDGSIDTAHIADSQVTTAKIAADAITGAKIADDAIDSEHYTDGSIDTAHIADLNVTQAKIANEAINEAKLQISNTPTNGYFLSAQSGNTGGLTWAEAGGGGKVLQVVSATDETIRSSTATSSSGYIQMSNTLEVNITPSATSSKVVVWIATGVRQVNREWQFTIFRDGTSGTDLGNSNHGLYYGEESSGEQINLMAIDSPNTTSQKSYGLFAKNQTALSDSTCHINSSRDGNKEVKGYIIAMEIGA